MINIFCVRPRGLNIGNDTIFLGLKHLLREVFGSGVNIIQTDALATKDGYGGGLVAQTIHEMNLYAHGVVIGGGNVYENGQLDVDLNALRALHPPLMLFSLSRGRIYDNRHELVARTDVMPDAVIRALHEKAAASLVRDEATYEHVQSLGISSAILGACPTLVLDEVVPPNGAERAGSLVSIRHPRLMSIPLRQQARIHRLVEDLVSQLEASGHGPVRLLCHDMRDVSFASSFGGIDYVVADDVHSHLALLRSARLVVTFRLHAFLPCLSFGTPAINLSYDERSLSLVRTLGLADWDIDIVRSRDVIAEVADRAGRLDELKVLTSAARPRWDGFLATMRRETGAFAQAVRDYAALGPA